MIMTPTIDSQDRSLMNFDIIQSDFIVDFFIVNLLYIFLVMVRIFLPFS